MSTTPAGSPPRTTLTRRGFLTATAATAATIAATPRFAFAASSGGTVSPLLVHLRLRGRRSFAAGASWLGSSDAFPSQADALRALFDAGQWARVAPSQARDERAAGDEPSSDGAWMLRLLDATGDSDAYLPALAIGEGGSSALAGSFETLAYADRRDLAQGADAFSPDLEGALRDAVWALQAGETEVALSGVQALAARDVAEWLEAGPTYRPAGGVIYPEGVLGQHLQEIAEAARSDLGLQLASLEVDASAVDADGGRALSDGLAALVQDLGAGLSARAAVVVEGGALGDGLWVLGSSVRGGLYGAPSQTRGPGSGADRVLAEVISGLYGGQASAAAFPGLPPADLGLFD